MLQLYQSLSKELSPEPLKVSLVSYIVVHERADDVSVVHLHSQQSLHTPPLVTGQLRRHQLCQLVQQRDHFLFVRLHSNQTFVISKAFAHRLVEHYLDLEQESDTN